ncbi:hypothetical protein CY34DRAFT_109454 [Suillus luteus UH-Slu-Lm8-n1]|uniref:Uncharacterized protein n=1 Tax=Suillus luteus UH-Slu-Lm8-n1 TaxID=930992 RepID=A0A0D0AES5_9AGAM|nr:hypothetical protein CY34DRAFT_109454 [Suillus luteus UH-Slu-Lm8-n1]
MTLQFMDITAINITWARTALMGTSVSLAGLPVGNWLTGNIFKDDHVKGDLGPRGKVNWLHSVHPPSHQKVIITMSWVTHTASRGLLAMQGSKILTQVDFWLQNAKRSSTWTITGDLPNCSVTQLISR